MKKKLFFTLLILLIILNCFYSNSFATSNVNVYYDPYENMRNDLDIVKNWARNNFSTYNDLYLYIYNKFNYSIPNSRKYIFIGNSYLSNAGEIIIILYGDSNIGNFNTVGYYGGTAQGFTLTGTTTRLLIRPSDNSLSDYKYISSVENSTVNYTPFIGYYKLKIDYLFSSSDLTDEINDNLSEIATSIEDTRTYLSDDTIYSDNEISSDKTEVSSIIQPEIDNFNNNSIISTIFGFYNKIIYADTATFKEDQLDLDFYIFDTHVTGSLNRNYTSDLLLRLCNNNTTTRNTIRNIIRSTYYLLFFLFFGKKFIDAFHKIITANFDGFHSGVELVNAL